jgi:2-dehydropantoate 2-reductase
MTPSVCIYGLGAIGGLIAARLAKHGVRVSAIARGATLEAVSQQDLTLLDESGESVTAVSVTGDPAALGKQDIVFVTLKSHAIPANAESIAGLMHADTICVAAQNGLPWWYFHGETLQLANIHLENVDPDGKIWNAIRPERALGAVVYPAATVTEPGVIRHLSGNKLSLGEPAGTRTKRITKLQQLLAAGGFEAPIADNLRAEIWLKLSANAALNPLSLVHRCAVGELLDDRSRRSELRAGIEDSQRLAAALGCPALSPADELLDALEIVRAHKTSMLVDYESGRELELPALTGAVIELAGRLGVSVDTLERIYHAALVRTGSGQ